MSIRINKIIKEFNVGLQTVVDVLASKGYEVRPVPSEKISEDQYELLRKEFGADNGSELFKAFCDGIGIQMQVAAI